MLLPHHHDRKMVPLKPISPPTDEYSSYLSIIKWEARGYCLEFFKWYVGGSRITTPLFSPSISTLKASFFLQWHKNIIKDEWMCHDDVVWREKAAKQRQTAPSSLCTLCHSRTATWKQESDLTSYFWDKGLEPLLVARLKILQIFSRSQIARRIKMTQNDVDKKNSPQCSKFSLPRALTRGS